MDIFFKVLRNSECHKDFFIQVGNMKMLADTYYFWREEFANLPNHYEGIEESISSYLDIWAKELGKLQLNESVFIPIDFSDEYVAGFKVRCLSNTFAIDYGYITDVNNIVVRVTSDEVYTNLNDKEFEVAECFHMEKVEFINLLHLTF
jgi:hypothetical protein